MYRVLIFDFYLAKVYLLRYPLESDLERGNQIEEVPPPRLLDLFFFLICPIHRVF